MGWFSVFIQNFEIGIGDYMANTGILLRKDNKQAFVGEFVPQEGEMVFAHDTFQLGFTLEGETYWQTWDDTLLYTHYLTSGEDLPDPSLGETGDKYIQVIDNNSTIELVEFRKLNGVWEKLIKGASQQFLDDFEVDDHTEDLYPYLGKYSLKMKAGYIPTEDLDIATQNYLNSVGGTGFITTNGLVPFAPGYDPQSDGDIITPNFMLSGDVEIVIPTTMPCVLGGGALWNDAGVIKFSTPCDPTLGLIRYYTTSNVTFNTGVKSPTNGYIDIIGNDFVRPTSGQDSVTKIEVLVFGGRTSWESVARSCYMMTDFVILATDTCIVENFELAWAGCNSLIAFPYFDTSSGTNFSSAWYNCNSMTTFPLIDVSGGTNFDFAWFQCAGLTSFPLVDLSNGTTFLYTWHYCTGLTSFPLIDFSSGIVFEDTWSGCPLTSFPTINVSKGTNFKYAWSYCEELTSFPLLDTSKGTIFRGTWYHCVALTSFPALNVSSGTDFNEAWRSCSLLPHCPGGNEVTIPSGATTTNMCTGI